MTLLVDIGLTSVMEDGSELRLKVMRGRKKMVRGGQYHRSSLDAVCLIQSGNVK